MSTRSNIKIIDENGAILLYKHHDGYPKEEYGMVELLTKFLKGSGISAQTMADDLVELTECEFTDDMHGDIRYYYEVNISTGKISVYEHDMMDNTDTLIDTATPLEAEA